MAVVPMKKVGIVAHAGDFERLTERLAELGMVQITRREGEATDSAKRLDADLTALERAIAFLQSRLDKRPPQLKLSIAQLSRMKAEFPIKDKLGEIDALRKSIEELSARKTSLEHAINALEPYAPLLINFADVRKLQSTRVRVGLIPKMLADALDDFDCELCEHRVFNSDANGVYVAFVCHKSAEAELDALLESCDFAEFHPEKHCDIPAVELTSLLEQLARATDELETAESSARETARELLPTLDAIRALTAMELSRANLAASAERTQKTLFLTGWTKRDDFEGLRENLLDDFDAVEFAEIPPDEGETSPVALKNPPVIEAFEVITDLYGRPRAGMVDPTPFIAPFFPIFFALCLTDAGYGLLLALFSGGMLAFTKLGAGARKFMRFILYSGITTIIIGALAGGWFGISLDPGGGFISRALLSIKLFDPLDNAIEFFAASVFLGVLQVSVGFVLSGVVGVRESANAALKLRAGLLALSWIAVTVGAGIFVANFLVPETIAPFVPIGTAGLKFGALGIVGFSIVLGIIGRRGVGASIGDGLAFDGLYGIVNLFGDLLSYARILALGLSTGVIAGVINIIAGQLSEMIPGVGIIIAGLLVIVGHTAYTGLSALGAFVHPARLHFVEYFTKFYEAGGEPFEPFARTIDGVEIVE